MKVLKCIKGAAEETVDCAAAFLAAGYGASSRKLDHELSKQRKARRNREEWQKFYKFIYKLKKDGLIEKAKRQKPVLLRITAKGEKILGLLTKRKNATLPSFSYKNDLPKNDKLILVIFDIPESERRKRSWLRSALKNMKFNLIQKSVWIGKVNIPKDFLFDLKKLNLIDFVEIFEISKTGSLTKLA